MHHIHSQVIQFGSEAFQRLFSAGAVATRISQCQLVSDAFVTPIAYQQVRLSQPFLMYPPPPAKLEMDLLIAVCLALDQASYEAGTAGQQSYWKGRMSTLLPTLVSFLPQPPAPHLFLSGLWGHPLQDLGSSTHSSQAFKGLLKCLISLIKT